MNDDSGRNAFMYASMLENISILEKLSGLGLSANSTDAIGNSILHIMISPFIWSNIIADWLLTHEINVDCRNNLGETATLLAAIHGKINAIKWLVSHNANLDIPRDRDGSTALHEAVAAGHINVMSNLLIHMAKVNLAKFNGNTPLHLACHKANILAIYLLLKAKAPIDAVNEEGNTPLLMLIKTSRASPETKLAALKYLLAKKAKTNVENFDGYNAKELAEEYFPEAVCYIENPESLFPAVKTMEATLIGEISILLI